MTVQAVSAYGQTLTAPGVIVRPKPELPDVHWPGGDGAVLLNGHRSKPVQRTSGGLAVTLHGKSGKVNIVLEGLALDFAMGLPLYAGDPTIQGGRDQTHNPYLAGIPIDSAPLAALAQLTGWGPAAVDVPSAQGGSSQLVACRNPAASAALILHHHGMQPDLSDGRRRVQREWLSGSHVYDIVAPDPGSTTKFAPFLRWWESNSKADGCLFQGYGKSSGGFSTLYDAKLPPGITWPSSGLRCPEQDHAAIDVQAIYAAITGDLLALRDACCGLESLISAMRYETSTGGRGLGHVIRGLAVTWGASLLLGQPTERFPVLLDFLLGECERRNVFGLAGSWAPFTDRGNMGTDSYHLNPQEVAWLADLLDHRGMLEESRDATVKLLARSTTVFMAGIHATACTLALELLWPVLSGDQRSRLWSQAEQTVGFLVRYGGTPAITGPDGKGGVVLSWPAGPLWDDVRPLDQYGLHPALAGLVLAEGHSASVAPRFVVPALEGYRRLLELPGIPAASHQSALATRALLLSGAIREAWGPWAPGKDETRGALECHHGLAIHGWPEGA